MYDHEGIFLTEKEFNAIKKFLDETGQAWSISFIIVYSKIK
jgi:hypothetical protein